MVRPRTSFLRSNYVRWVAVVLLCPLMALGSFGGLRLFIHQHADSTIHAHTVGGLGGAPLDESLSAQTLASACRHETHVHAELAGTALAERVDPTLADTVHPVQPGIVLSVPDHDQLASRGVGLDHIIALPATVLVFDPAPVADSLLNARVTHTATSFPPRDLLGLSACQRLVRVSGALLL